MTSDKCKVNHNVLRCYLYNMTCFERRRNTKTDTFCPIAYFFLFALSKVLTGFYLPMGATLIPGACMPGFEHCSALDAPVGLQLCLLLLAWKLQTYYPQLCKEVLARSLQGIFFTVMSCIIGTEIA